MYSKDLEINVDLNKKEIATNVLITTSGTDDHAKLKNRDIENQHPISAITGLSETLEAKQDVINDLDIIRQGAELGATALQSYTETDPIYTADKPNIALKSEIPTKVSSLTNDANYQTDTDVMSMIASIPQFKVKIVDELPAEGQKMVLYLVPKTSASGDDIYDEYIWLENTSSFELIGTTTVDLSDYYTKGEVNGLLDSKVDKEEDKTLISQTELNRLAGVNNYDDTQIKSDISSLQNEKTTVIIRDWSVE